MRLAGITMCSGIGAPECAAQLLGLDVRWLAAAEIEPFPSAVHAARFPGVPNVGDLTAHDWSAYRGLVDVVVAGTPCQAFSVAGLRRGLSDERGNLTLQFVRAVDAIDPLFTVWENVPGVLSSRDNAFGAFLAGICGDDEPLVPNGRWPNAGVVVGPTRSAAWRVLDAQYFGVAQRRRRVFVVACPRGGPDPFAVLFEPEGVQRHLAPRREAGEGLARGRSPRGDTGDPIVAVPGGDAVVGTTEFLPQSSRVYMPDAVAPALQATGSRMGNRAPQVLTSAVGFGSADGAGDGTVSAKWAKGTGGPAGDEAYNLVAFDTTQDPISSADVTHALGTGSKQGGATVAVAFQANSRDEVRLVGSDGATAGCLTDEGRVRRGPTTQVAIGTAVRRLTPTECERLQGFPDGWTDVVHRGKPAADGPRYKAIGNSMAVPVLGFILARLHAEAVRHLEDMLS